MTPLKKEVSHRKDAKSAKIFKRKTQMFFVLSARAHKAGYYGLLFWGIFLALAGILKHLPQILKPEPYWSGAFSKTLIMEIIIVGITLAITSILALRQSAKLT